MSNFKLSARSLNRMNGVDKSLVNVVKRAIEITEVDFGVIQGLRTVKEQEALFASGASQTMNSKHLTGRAVDCMAYIGLRGSWEMPLYFKIAEAFKRASKEQGTVIRWGGAWTCRDIAAYDGTMEQAQSEYIAYRRSIEKSIFIDGPHFELMRA